MPVGLKFQREHRYLGYKLKYFYYFFFRREILQKKRCYGEKNIDKTFYIIKPDYQDGVEGLLSLIFRQILYIDYAKRKGYIPFVDWKNYVTQYSDGENNAWSFFFKQPSNINEKEIYNSKNVYISGWTFKDINSKGLFESRIFFDDNSNKQSHEVLISNLEFNDEVLHIVEKEARAIDIDNCIGVYVRGTDYIKLRPSGEYIQPDIKQVKRQISNFISTYHAPVYLVTEDGSIYDELIKTFGKSIRIVSFDSFIRDYDGKNVLSKSNVLDENKKQRGQKYLVKMILLSRCKYLISSITQGSKFSYALNGGKYKDKYIFDLGLYS